MTESTPELRLIGPPDSREISSAHLLSTRGELTIIHNGERYTLRITANKKLILTK